MTVFVLTNESYKYGTDVALVASSLNTIYDRIPEVLEEFDDENDPNVVLKELKENGYFTDYDNEVSWHIIESELID